MYKDLFRKIFLHSPKRTFLVIGGLIVAISLPITLATVQQQQDVRQRASGPDIATFNFNHGSDHCRPQNKLCEASLNETEVQNSDCSTYLETPARICRTSGYPTSQIIRSSGCPSISSDGYVQYCIPDSRKDSLPSGWTNVFTSTSDTTCTTYNQNVVSSCYKSDFKASDLSSLPDEGPPTDGDRDIPSTDLTETDIKTLQDFRCTAAEINSRTNCVFTVPTGKTIPPQMQIKIGNGTFSSSCYPAPTDPSKGRCTGVVTGTESGSQNIYARLISSDITGFDIGKDVVISGTVTTTNNTRTTSPSPGSSNELTCDPNGDGTIDIHDLDLWRAEYIAKTSNTNKFGCFAEDKTKVDILDFNVWRDIAILKKVQAF